MTRGIIRGMGYVTAPEDALGDAAEKMVADILERLRGRLEMNLRTANAYERPEDYRAPLFRSTAYAQAIQDVEQLAREAGFLR